MAEEPGAPTVSFKKAAFRKAGGSKGIRKRPRTEGSDEEPEVPTIVQTDKKGRRGLNVFSTGATGASKAGQEIEDAPTTAGQFKSTREVLPASSAEDAVRYSEIDTSADRDARSILERNIQLNKDGATNDDTKIYRGQAGYKNYITKNEAQAGANKYTGTQGPIRAPTNLRATARFDYQMDVCKDYKETGYCGFGDSCKFMHDRGDYKSGWMLENAWDEKQKKKREMEMQGLIDEGNDDDQYLIKEDDDLPFSCFICREGFRNPVVTNCGHYFCEQCGLDHYRGNTRCAACGKQTSGVFNVAHKLIAKLEKRGMLKRLADSKASAKPDGDDDDGNESDYAVREDGAELTHEPVSKAKQGSWATVAD